MKKTLLDRYKGCLVGLAVGDALGTTLEFLEKEDLEKGYTHKNIIGMGKLNLPKGDYTDDPK
jgi:ADP-ribosyl-[dinitrogen reductase] hydrolase